MKHARLLLVLEASNSTAFLPYLTLLACISGAGSIQALYPGFRSEKVTRLSAPFALGRILAACVFAQRAVRVCRAETTHLLDSARIPLSRFSLHRTLYLKASGAFGLAAGGSIGHMTGVVNALQARGLRVDAVAPHVPPLLDSRVQIHNLRMPKTSAVPQEANFYSAHQAIVNQGRELFADKQFDVIYSRLTTGNYAGVVLSREAGIPFVLEYNGSEAWAAENWGHGLRYRDLALAAEQVCLKHAHLVVCVSDVLRDELLERGIAPERIVCYPNCIDPSIFDPAHFSSEDSASLRRQHHIDPSAVVVAFTGTFGQWHGVDVLAEAIRQLLDRDLAWARRQRAHFLLVGDGQYMPHVRQVLSGERYAPFVTLTGLVTQDRVPAFLAASDIVVASHIRNPDGSRFFGSPTKLFEYMAMGKSILASDLDQIGQVLTPGLAVNALPTADPSPEVSEMAVLTPPGDHDGLIKGLQFLVERPAWRSVLGRNARREALARYTWEQHVAAIIDRLVTLSSVDYAGRTT